MRAILLVRAYDDRGPVVLAWQQALIAPGVISDRPANRDSHYGGGMMKAVMRLQKSWEWSDADGVAGKHTWSKLHGGSALDRAHYCRPGHDLCTSTHQAPMPPETWVVEPRTTVSRPWSSGAQRWRRPRVE
jgi:hypothetical protein